MIRIATRFLILVIVSAFVLIPAAEAAGPHRAVDLLQAEDGTPFKPGEGWVLDDTGSANRGLFFLFRSPDAPDLTVLVEPRDEDRPTFQRTPSFNISHRGNVEGLDTPRGRLLRRVVDAILRNDGGGIDLSRLTPIAKESAPEATIDDPTSTPRKGLLGCVMAMEPAGRVQVQVVFLLLLVSLASLFLSFSLQRRAWRESTSVNRWFVAVALAAGLIIRLFVAPRVVMVYMAFDFTGNVASFESLPRYGAGAFTFYRLLFELLPTDHLTIIQVNTWLGFLTIPAILTFVKRHRPGGPAVPVLAVLLSLTPMFICDHRTESILIVVVFFLWHGLLLLDGFLVHRSRLSLAGAVPLLGLAALSRPEMVIIVPLGVAIILIARGREGLRSAWIQLSVAGLVTSGLVALQIHHLFGVVP